VVLIAIFLSWCHFLFRKESDKGKSYKKSKNKHRSLRLRLTMTQKWRVWRKKAKKWIATPAMTGREILHRLDMA
jgi:hypothetical protein